MSLGKKEIKKSPGKSLVSNDDPEPLILDMKDCLIQASHVTSPILSISHLYTMFIQIINDS